MSTTIYKASFTIDKDGRMPQHHRDRLKIVFHELRTKSIEIAITEPKKYSTNLQRNYYFAAIVTPIQEFFASHGQWYDKDDLHDMMMTEIGQLWIENPNPFTEKVEKKRRSYNSLSTQEAEQYHLKCIAWASTRNIEINEPEQKQ